MRRLLQILNGGLVIISGFIGYLFFFLIGREILVVLGKIKRSDLQVLKFNNEPNVSNSMLSFVIGLAIFNIFMIIIT